MSEIPVPVKPAGMRLGKFEPEARDFAYGLCAFVTGLGIGWFLGLSLESLGTAIIAPILALITGTAGVLAGVGVTTSGVDGATRANPFMVMLLVVGLVGGSVVSTLLRVNLLLGPDADKVALKTGLTVAEVNKRGFDKIYPPNPPVPVVTNSIAPIKPAAPVPGQVNAKIDCSLLQADDKTLVAGIRKVNDPALNLILDQPAKLRLAVRAKCQP